MEAEKPRRGALQMDVISGETRLRQFSELLNQAFAVPEGLEFLSDFPVWNGTEARRAAVRAGVFAPAGRLAGCAAARIAQLHAPNGKIPVGIIGAVATDPLYRGQGVASETVRFLLGWLAGQNVAMTVLWGNETEFYEKLGFRPFGAQTAIAIDGFLTSLPDSARTGEVRRGWVDGIFTRLLERRTGLAHAPEDLDWIREHRNVSWYWMGNPSRPDAYVGVNRGIDLQGFVHEWGGDRAALKALLESVARENPHARLLGSPELFGKSRSELVTMPLGLAAIHDPSAILAAYGIGPERVPRTEEAVLRDARTLFGDPQNDGLPVWFWGLDSA